MLKEIDILKIINTDLVIVKCAYCDGNGFQPATALSDEDPSDPCCVCKGKGFKEINQRKDNLTICGLCQGTGRGVDDSGYFLGGKCEVCSGLGVVPIVESEPGYKSFWQLLHPKIAALVKSRYDSCHYSDAVETAFKFINEEVKKIVKERTNNEYDGASLMTNAFSVNNPIIRLSDLSNDSEKNTQQGYMQIFAGSMIGIRNPKAHAVIDINELTAIHLLFLASLLFHQIENSLRDYS